jgi:hypothetical protein
MDKPNKETEQRLPLPEAVSDLLEECRMVLPGIQALFGFQLVATFSERFSRDLSTGLQQLHLLAIGLIAIAIGLIMTPAAYHRQYAPQHVSQALIRRSSALLLASMPPLALGICLDFYVVAHLVIGSDRVAWWAAVLLLVYVGLWFVFPQWMRWRRRHR